MEKISKKLIWGGQSKQFNKKRLIFPVIFLVLLLIIGTSYALWNLTFRQTSTNQINTSCFKINFTEKDDINLENAYPLTDEEGKNLTPYTFTIENICNTSAFYQINLEELATSEKRLSNNYIKVSLNKSTGKILSTYQTVDKTLDTADISHKLTTGRLNENEKKDFELRLWLDEDTSLNEDVINATFASKVTIITVHRKDFENDLNVETKSLTETYTNTEESIEFTAHSRDYNIIEISEDNTIFNPVDIPSKNVTITKTYNIDGTYTMYFKDEVDNIIEANATTTKLDKEPPNVVIEATELNGEIKVNLSKSTDNKSKIKKYYYKLNDNDYIESTTNNYIFTGLSDGKYNIIVKLEDNAGNITDEVTKEVTVAYEHVYISSTGNDTTGNGSPASPYATLQRAYSKVKSGGEILLLSDINATSTTNMNTANKEVTLKSNGENTYSVTKASTLTSGILNIDNSNTVTTTNIIFDGNNVNSTNSLIKSTNSTLNLNKGTTVKNNIEVGNIARGGGLYVLDSTLNINGATISDNRIQGTNKYSSLGGGLLATRSTVNFNSGNILRNKTNWHGGGIAIVNATLYMNGGTVSSNNAVGAGGILVYSGTMTMTGGTISNNAASEQAGGIYTSKGPAAGETSVAYIRGGKIENNTAPTGPNTYAIDGTRIIYQ